MSTTSAQTEAIYEWLNACKTPCKGYALHGDIPSHSGRQGPCDCKPVLDHSTSQSLDNPSGSSSFADRPKDEALFGRDSGRGHPTQSQGQHDRSKEEPNEAYDSSSESPPVRMSHADDVNVDQLHPQKAHSTTATSTTRGDPKLLSPDPINNGLLREARPPIRVGMMEAPPEAVRVLMGRFTDICDGFGVLPLCLKINENHNRELHSFLFDHTATAEPYDHELFEKLRCLLEAAGRCCKHGKPEPSWEEEVFRPMLNLAVESENRDGSPAAQVENVVTSRINPHFLVPTTLRKLPSSFKRVDYGIYLSQTDDQESSNRDILRNRNIDIREHGVNQAGSSSYIKWLPQLAAIECKNTLPGTDGVVRLGIWMAALRERLEGLMKEFEPSELDLKPMPCLKVEGLYWKMYWCYIGAKGETMLYGPQLLGSMTDMKGMYQILKALREIVKYGRDEYWPWFRETILWEN